MPPSSGKLEEQESLSLDIPFALGFLVMASTSLVVLYVLLQATAPVPYQYCPTHGDVGGTPRPVCRPRRELVAVPHSHARAHRRASTWSSSSLLAVS